MALKGLTITRAQKYLKDVIDHKDCVPFRKYTGGISRTAQSKAHKHHNGRWPEKSCRFLLDLLVNATANASVKGIDADKLFIRHVQVQRAPKQRRRTYRAHGRITAYKRSPCHVQFVFAKKADKVAKADASRPKTESTLQSGATGF